MFYTANVGMCMRLDDRYEWELLVRHDVIAGRRRASETLCAADTMAGIV